MTGIQNTGLVVAQELCRRIYECAQENNVPVYPALTGGTLYKDGDRKDIDIVMYSDVIITEGMNSSELNQADSGLKITGGHILTLCDCIKDKEYNSVWKCYYKGYKVDILWAVMLDKYKEEGAETP